MSEINIMDQVSLMKITFYGWSNKISLKDPENIQSVLSDSNYDKDKLEWLKISIKMIKAKELKNISSIIYNIRKIIKRHCIPFPIEGVYLVKDSIIPNLENILEKQVNLFNGEVERLIENYDHYKEEAKNELKEIFKEEEYPTKEVLADKFKIKWTFFKITSSPATKYTNNFNNLIKEAQENTIEILKISFLNLLKHLNDKLDNKSEKTKKIKKSSITKIQEFIENFENLNIFNDESLKSYIDKCREFLSNITLDNIKNNKEYYKENLNNIINEVENIPKRKILI